ncbi:MAG: arginine--tRNA ligase [Armatimonadetes bacterium]|nr:arginine--tRNA ligase [Candidatus Hippobium faecium]
MYTYISDAIKKILDIEEVSFNKPPKKEMGDFSTAVCMSMAKVLHKAPIAIAGDVKEKLEKENLPFIKSIQVTPPGYLNFFIDFPAYTQNILDTVFEKGDFYGTLPEKDERVLIEHTNVNPNKAMHIGHLRNAIIGDSVVRTLRKLGYNVQACNYIDDTGVQVADVVAAMLYLDEPFYNGGDDFSNIWAKVDDSISFDYWCWDIYARIGEAYEKDPVLKGRRAEILHAVEGGDSAVASFAKEVATKIVYAHLKTVSRLNIYYDLLNWESDIFNRKFWQTAFDLLKEKGAVEYEPEGPNAGCWVVRFGKGIIETDEGLKSEDKILVRSNGIVTYTGKDIAYQMWKFGCLGRDFLFKDWGVQNNGEMLTTTSPDGKESEKWGRAHKVINVIDCRQSYTQQIVYDCLQKMGFEKASANSVHLGYEIVTLSKDAAKDMGANVDENSSAVAMSGRKGLGIKGDDLIEIIKDKLREKVKDEKSLDILACAAIRYFMSKITTGKMIIFDFEEALRTTGDSGIYCEYAYARASSIIEKSGIDDFSGVKVPETVSATESELVSKIKEYETVLQKAGEDLSPAPLARYAFELSGVFTSYYENPDPGKERVAFINIADPNLKLYRLALVQAFRQTLRNCLDTLGIETINKI